MIISSKIYPTDTSVFITIQKVASTLLGSLFDDSEKTGMGFDYSIDIQNKKIICAENVIGTLQQKVLNEFDAIFSNTSDKNIIILYRNPINRLKSSIIEDFNSIITSTDHTDFTQDLLFKLFNASPRVQEFIKINADSFYLSEFDETDDEIINFLKKSFSFYIEFLSNSNFNNAHSNDYLKNFYNLIHSNIFDERKIILCDIDSKLLTPLLNKFSIFPDYENHTHSNGIFLPIIDQILSDITNTNIYSKYTEKIQSEYEYYELLKKHTNNFKIEK
jgi:hypothetical protein